MKNNPFKPLLAATAALLLTSLAWGYALITNDSNQPIAWPAGTVSIQILADNSTHLSDGTTRATSIQAAAQAWNPQIGWVQFSTQIGAAGPGTDHNHTNEIFFSASPYSYTWDSNTLAITTVWYAGAERREGDIIFNTTYTWDSYRGVQAPSGSIDIRRVALHELGHVLGLDHPDEIGQSVSAIMNSTVSNLDALTSDDISGARSLYGAPNATPTAPSITYHPYDQSILEGNSVSFSVSVSGSVPLALRWQRLPAGSATWADLSDGGNYAGTGTSYLTVSSVTVAMNGDKFRCNASNSAGTATSNSASLTVTPVVAPTISGLPATLTVNYGESIYLYPQVNGTYPYTIQWFKDGVPIAGATFQYFSKYNCRTTDSGSYTMTATNSAGTATSPAVTVTVSAVVAPSITQQPASVTVAKGYSASFNVNATGSQPLLFQWYRNGQQIPYATSSYYGINSPVLGDAGLYSVTVTNDGGTVASVPAELTVLPAQLPKITSFPGGTTISPNNTYLSFYVGVTGTEPMTYQWYKDGVAIAGATSSSYYNYSANAGSAGVYTLRVANEAGIAMSPDAVVSWSGATGTAPWLDAVQQGNVVYFLATSPGRIMRYDLAQETWLSITYLPETKVPTAFLPSAEGVFIAYNQELVRRTLDLQTEVAVATSTAAIQALFSAGDLIYYQEGQTTRSRNRATLSAGPDSSPGYYESGYLIRPARPIFSAATRFLYTTRPNLSPNDIEKFSVAPGGVITLVGDSPYHGDFRIGSRQYFSPDELSLIDNSGVIYKTADLTYAAALGRPFDDLTFLADGTPVALRGQFLTAHGGAGFADNGQYPLATTAYALFSKGSTCFAFGAPSSTVTNPSLTKVPRASFVTAGPGVRTSPVNKLISVEDAFLDSNKVINLLSRSEQGVVRWDTATRSFLTTLPLRGHPNYASYAPALDRLVLIYGDGALSDLFAGNATAEESFGYIPSSNTPFSLVAMDDLTFLNIHQADVSADLRIVLGSSGELNYLSNWNYWGTAQAWQSAGRRLYSVSNLYSNGSMDFALVSAAGVPSSSSSASVTNVLPPLRFSADGNLVLTANQRILNADLQQIGVLENPVTDGIWLTNSLLTIRSRANGTELQKWARITYTRTGAVSLPGIPLRIFRLSDDSVAVVTLVGGYLAFSVVSSDLSLVSYSLNSTPVPGGPIITAQPVNQTVTGGTSATFSVTASGIPAPVYQWLRNGVTIPGATGSSFTIASATTGDEGAYTVVASNLSGLVTSAAAALKVNPAPMGTPADFNADGKPDLIWSNSQTGERALWLMTGTNFLGASTLGNFPLEWTIAATGDFNGDGKPDLVWSNSVTGERALWLMDGTNLLAVSTLGIFPLEWTIAATGDFNGDGKPDLVWSNSVTGERALWLMNGTNLLAVSTLGIFPLEWTVAATGDFNGDGKPDLVWSNSLTGERALWLMDGTTRIGVSTLGIFPLEWTVAGTADFNGDGKPDIIWSNSVTGERALWLMDGTTRIGVSTLGIFPLEWTVSN